MAERFQIAIPNTVGVSGLSYPAAEAVKAGITLLLGHGAGAPQESRWMVAYASELAARGIDVVTFNFLYMEQKRRVPDRAEQLETCYRAAIDAARARTPSSRLAIGGKSMGGRIASQVAAALPDGGASNLLGLVFLGYPLHPPGQPNVLRTSHLPRVQAPMLFVQGTRDSFGTPDELTPVIATLSPRATIHAVMNGDHSLSLPKKSGTPESDVRAGVCDRIVRWLRERA
jgi:predicted alpha/beta-hydrolase family hydrolase